jgi:GNAT superfamily N-acetyltransferase
VESRAVTADIPLVRPLHGRDVLACAQLVAEAPLWKRYGYGADRCAADLTAALDAGKDALFCLELAAEPVGVAWVLPRGTFGRSPYLKLIAVAERHRGRGLGASLLAAAENVGDGELTLLVSDFNGEAQRFYLEHGYREVGALEAFVLPGVTERILRKTRAPVAPLRPVQ